MLTQAENVVIAVVHPVATVTKNLITKKNKRESISLLHNSRENMVQVLPRNDLQHRSMITEHRFKNSTSKYIIANSQKVKQLVNLSLDSTSAKYRQQTLATCTLYSV